MSKPSLTSYKAGKKIINGKAIKKGILTKGGTKKRDAVNKRLGKLDKQYGAIRQFKRNTDTVRTFDIFFLVTNNDKTCGIIVIITDLFF